MFEQAIAAELAHTNRAYTALLGLAGQAFLVSATVMAPLLVTPGPPRTAVLNGIFTFLAPPPAPQAPAVQTPQRPERVFQYRKGRLTAPSTVPAVVAAIVEPPLTPAELGGGAGTSIGVPGGTGTAVPGSVTAWVADRAAPAPPVQAPAPAVTPAAPAQPPRYKLGGIVKLGQLLVEVKPAYPLLARQARISGTVHLAGVIGTDGRIRELQVISGHPLLIKAALDAVRQWVYRPTLLNGEPVEVVAPILITFNLN